jgi:asparagine synthase (glutamine-hydrolysing)
MCGLAGLVYFDRSRQIDPTDLKAMGDSIAHRGPDDEGFYVSNNVGLAFRRLSIIDLSAGHQPLSNSNNTINIVFNGEIYNFLELRKLLEPRGYVFKTHTDTEVILHMYEEFGIDCLTYLRGMFAFCIWDNNKQQFFCARDRFGIKPFYYYTDNEKFVFGSEIKAILKAKDIEARLSYEALESYFAFGYITSDLSVYTKIKKLQPGHYLLLSFKEKPSIEIQRYWDICFEPDYSKTETQWTEEIESLFSEAVKLHMISDVPLGAFLSGGIDSSSVVAAMAKNSNQPIQTFSIGFKEQKYNELEFAREVAKKYNCIHREQIVEPESINLLPKLVNAYDEPFADSSAIPTYYVSKFAREHVTVALSGDGGDELFAGYWIYRYFKNVYQRSSSSSSLNNLLWGNIHKLIPQKIAGKGLTYFLSKNREYLGAYLCIWSKEERKKLILNNHSLTNYKHTPELYKEGILKDNKKNDFITNLQNLDMQTYMVDDILTKVDRASMLNSLEVRVPLLDHKFAELSFKIPSRLKLHGKDGKYILKAAMSTALPENILKHPKQGFAVPLSAWFKDDLKEYINDTVLSPKALLSNYVDKNYVRKIVDDNKNGMRDFSSKIWSLVFFEEWLKQNPLI